MNQRFEKTDVLVSLAKLKQHATAGITGVVKNCFGNTPSSIYGDDGPGEHALKHRAAMFHGGGKQPPAGAPAEFEHGLPKKGVDPRAADHGRHLRRPPGRPGDHRRHPHDQRRRRALEPRHRLEEPKLLLVGRNGVCTDASHGRDGLRSASRARPPPFQGDNHLRLLASVGVGTNDLRRIEVRGLPLKDAVCPFDPPKTPVPSQRGA